MARTRFRLWDVPPAVWAYGLFRAAAFGVPVATGSGGAGVGLLIVLVLFVFLVRGSVIAWSLLFFLDLLSFLVLVGTPQLGESPLILPILAGLALLALVLPSTRRYVRGQPRPVRRVVVVRDRQEPHGWPMSSPAFHYRPPSGWMNDPNGLIFHDGEYHLYYQHHPHSEDFGPTHWGHAVSTDLVSWADLPIALAPDEHGHIYSGSMVVDRAGDAGFGPGALVAAFTHFTPTSQAQSLAGSTDRGRTFTPHPRNPVLAQPPGVADFRDPKVLRFGGRDDGHWVMIVAAGDHARLYRSANLTGWEHVSSFAEPRPADGVWETPDLFELAVEGTGERRWVLTAGVLADDAGGAHGTRYWVGRFDGRTFTPDAPGTARWADHGTDFYAAQTWTDVADRRVWIAWMSNWSYAARVPEAGWRGQMTVPRELRLVRTDGALALAQRPVRELLDRFGPAEWISERVSVESGAVWIRFAVPGDATATTGLELAWGAARARVVCDPAERTLSLDRSRAADVGLGATYHAVQRAPAGGVAGEIAVDVLVDRWSVEVFAADGRVTLTALVVPSGDGATAVVISPVGSLTEPIELRPFRG